MLTKSSLLCLLVATLANGSALPRRAVDKLDPAALAEAQKRDDTAVRAFSNVEIKTTDGQCLFVDPLSGDFRANLTPVQVAQCGSTAGQGWDVITSGVHNDQPGELLIVNTLTQACLNFDVRRKPGDQVNLFSCGGRADGSGKVTSSQLFKHDGMQKSSALQPQCGQGICLTVRGNVIDVAACNANDGKQVFSAGAAAKDPSSQHTTSLAAAAAATTSSESGNEAICTPETVTVTSVSVVTMFASAGAPQATELSQISTSLAAAVTTSAAAADTTQSVITAAAATTEETAATSTTTAAASASSTATAGSGDSNNDGGAAAAIAQANAFDSTATRPIQSVNIRASDGRCLSIDPKKGDFRENLIPVQLRECTQDPSQKFDFITAGKHNDGKAKEALISSVLMDGCLTFSGRRNAADRVSIFSCGGRANGSK